MKKNKRLKILTGLVMILIVSLLNLNLIVGLGLSAPSSVKPNESFTATVSGLSNIRGKFFVEVSNGSANKSSFFANGSSSESISVKAGASGSVTVTVKPDTVSDTATIDGELITNTLSKTVKISVPSTSSTGSGNNTTTPSTGTGNSTKTPTNSNDDKKSKENNLSSLTISTGELSPAFDSSKTSYNVSLPGATNEITISAKAKDSKASVEGTGKKSLTVGDNTVKVICKAENGSTKTYTIVFHVDETPLVYTKVDDVNLGVVRNLDGVKVPDGYEKTTTKLENQDVDAFKNDKMNLTIVYLVNEAGEKSFYIIDEGKVQRKYETITVGNKLYVIFDGNRLEETNSLKEATVKIGDIELNGWVFTDKNHANYSIVYLMNDAGEKSLYSYEATEGTLQKYVPNTSSSNNVLTYVFIGTTALLAVSTGIVSYLYLTFKKKSIAAIKDYYEAKNQGE